MSEVVIVDFLKPGKNTDLYTSYCPISLLHVDIKLLTKILANGLNVVITALAHPDQSRFMPGRGIDADNICRLFTHMTLATSDKLRIMASLNAEKEFDSFEWEYLWAVLDCFGFCPKCMSWLKLYACPTAQVFTNGTLPAPFPLESEMRQGCPLSPDLFVLASETPWNSYLTRI